MEAQQAIDLGRQAIMISLWIGAPVLLAGMLVGLIIGLLQALTQVQDQTVSFVPKVLAMVLVLGLCLPWLIQQMVEYSQTLYQNIPSVIAGG
jgi:flagellar biosynthetic protein FliQ